MPAFSLRAMPSVDALINHASILPFVASAGRDTVVYVVRMTEGEARRRALGGEPPPSPDCLVGEIVSRLSKITAATPRRIINATGIVLHTNLGRAVLGKEVLDDIAPVITGYSTVEFDCDAGARGNRNEPIAALLRYLTRAEDVVVVNNNAAGIVLTLSTLAKDREVIVSRGELIEIGGEFRIPDIMAASGARMVEVGTTNRTRLADYEKAVNERTALIFKAHKSNYAMSGFVEEASIKQLAELAQKHSLPLVYDIGSGLLRKPKGLPLDNEPDVASSLADGADIVLFSGDKLLGGPQAGIIAGKKEYVARLARAPIMRALRVGKLTLAALSSACRQYLSDQRLMKNIPTFAMLSRQPSDILRSAVRLKEALASRSITASIVETSGQCGGGALPQMRLSSHAVKLEAHGATGADRSKASEKIHRQLLLLDLPVLGILREGEVLFDLRTVEERDIEYIAEAVEKVIDNSYFKRPADDRARTGKK
jgi:L-seryl-tRNA(Ser) seleniumtransferase